MYLKGRQRSHNSSEQFPHPSKLTQVYVPWLFEFNRLFAHVTPKNNELKETQTHDQKI